MVMTGRAAQSRGGGSGRSRRQALGTRLHPWTGCHLQVDRSWLDGDEPVGRAVAEGSLVGARMERLININVRARGRSSPVEVEVAEP